MSSSAASLTSAGSMATRRRHLNATVLPDGTVLEMHTTLNCPLPDKQCYFTTQAQRRDGDAVEGFPGDLWARQTTTIRSKLHSKDFDSIMLENPTKEVGKFNALSARSAKLEGYTPSVWPFFWNTGLQK